MYIFLNKKKQDFTSKCMCFVFHVQKIIFLHLSHVLYPIIYMIYLTSYVPRNNNVSKYCTKSSSHIMCFFLELHFLHSISHILQIISHIAYSTFHIFNYNSFCIIYIPQIICLLHHVSHISCSMHSIFNTSFLIFRDFASHISCHTYFKRLI